MEAMLLSVLLFLCSGILQAQRIIDTEYGQVRGHLVNVNNGVEQTTVEVFYGIPFAKDTSGPRRFSNPEPPDPWPTILEADTMGDACPQASGSIEGSIPDWSSDEYSEDCLNLNIYMPAVVGVDPYPVMFWIYGGSYQIGANVQYPGHFLASRGVIVVTVNYRVNKFGFAFTGNDACPGNAGMWDQNAGLQFVVNNIANFGGDPTKITVFGQSAGATSASLHLLSPQSKDLFQQAIIESGAEITDWTINLPQTHPENYTYQMAESLGCSRPDDYDMMDCMRALSWRQVYYNSSFTCEPGYTCMGMIPVVDGPTGFLPALPSELRAMGSVMQGPIISGITEEDASLFLPPIVPGVVVDGCCNRTYFSYALQELIMGYFRPRLSNITEEQCYHALDFNYTPWPHIHNTDSNRNMLVKLYTDWSYGLGFDKQLKEHVSVAPSYGFLYDYMSSTSTLEDWLGTVHGAEINYVFGFPLLEFNQEVQDDARMPADNLVFNGLDLQYSLFMQELWTNFAKYGNPTPLPVDNPLGGSTIWPQFNLDTMDILYFGADSINTMTEYSQKDYAFWTEYLMWMAGEELGHGST